MVVAVLAAIALAAGSAFAWLSRYDPIEQGPYGGRPAGAVDPIERDVSLGGGPVSTTWSVAPTEGVPFAYRFSIANDGPVAVTITAIGSPGWRDFVVEREALAVTIDPIGPGRDTRIEPFAPFTLEPGAHALITMGATVRRCPGNDAMMAWSAHPITFRVLGVTRTVEFEPSVGIEVRGRRCVRT